MTKFTPEQEQQVFALCEDHCDRVVIGTPTKLVLEAKSLATSMQATRDLQREGFEVVNHTLGKSVFMHVTL